MSAFALGEIEDSSSSDGLLQSLDDKNQAVAVRARIIEALGKVGSLAPGESALPEKITQRLLGELPSREARLTSDQQLAVTLTITALTRLRSTSAVAALSDQLLSAEVEVRAAAANALFRIRRPIVVALSNLVLATNDSDAIVRANAARALGLTGESSAYEPLLRLLADHDERVRVNAIRGLAALGEARSVKALLETGEGLLEKVHDKQSPEINLLLEIATAVGTLKALDGVGFLERLRQRTGVGTNPEVEVALARLKPSAFLAPLERSRAFEWRQTVNLAQGWARFLRCVTEGAGGTAGAGRSRLKRVGGRSSNLRAMRRAKYEGLGEMLEKRLLAHEASIRATAAQLLGETKSEATLNSLITALELAKHDARNEARLATLEAIAGFKSERAIAAIQPLVKDRDYLVRKHAIEALWKLGIDRGSIRAEPVGAGRSRAYYDGVARRAQRPAEAVIQTDKGDDHRQAFCRGGTLTVDNFVTLARASYFNGTTFHRVVANFVVQGGDPRGDGNGGPGHQIRCEINLHHYGRGAVGMALFWQRYWWEPVLRDALAPAASGWWLHRVWSGNGRDGGCRSDHAWGHRQAHHDQGWQPKGLEAHFGCRAEGFLSESAVSGSRIQFFFLDLSSFDLSSLAFSSFALSSLDFDFLGSVVVSVAAVAAVAWPAVAASSPLALDLDPLDFDFSLASVVVSVAAAAVVAEPAVSSFLALGLGLGSLGLRLLLGVGCRGSGSSSCCGAAVAGSSTLALTSIPCLLTSPCQSRRYEWWQLWRYLQQQLLRPSAWTWIPWTLHPWRPWR
jgi:HEAT repeat protein